MTVSLVGLLCLGSGCGDPGTPDNALREGEDFSTGSIVRYSCNNGLYLSGGAFRVCQMDGTWSGTAPECTGMVNFLQTLETYSYEGLEIAVACRLRCFPVQI